MSTPMPTSADTPDLNTQSPTRLGWISLFVLIGLLGTWAAFSVISGAVIASGQAVVHGKPKQIQSLDGGVVAELLVQDGDIVQAGERLMRLDPTVLEVPQKVMQKLQRCSQEVPSSFIRVNFHYV